MGAARGVCANLKSKKMNGEVGTMTGQPRRWVVYVVAAVILGVFVVVALLYRSHRDEAAYGVEASVDFTPYVSAYTSGLISRTSPVQVVFARDVVAKDKVGTEAESGVLKFSPRIKGKAVWANARTLEFIPREPLESDTHYRAKVAIDELFENVPEEAETLVFSFYTLRQRLMFDNLHYYSVLRDGKPVHYAQGRIVTSDATTIEALSEGLRVSQDGEELEVDLSSTGESRVFALLAPLHDTETPVTFRFDGEAIGMEGKVSDVLPMPDVSNFSFCGYNFLEGNSQRVDFYFSQPLATDQNLRGLVHGADVGALRLRIDGNALQVYPTSRLAGDYRLEVEQAVRNYAGQNLPEGFACTIAFSSGKPEVEFLQKGAILPATGQVQIPIRARALKGVDVYIFEIFENNIAQFFQSSSYAWQYDLHRVGRLIKKKTVMLEGAMAGGSGVYALDLSSIIKLQPGAIYRVGLGMRRCLAQAPCSGDEAEPIVDVADIPSATGEHAYYGEEYDWQQRDNPCSDSYYMHHETEWNLLLVTNIGLIAKRTAGNQLWAFATSISESKPMAGVDMELLDYQLQPIGKGKTDGDGAVHFDSKPDQEPFLLVASQGQQRAYLNVRGSSDLSFSTFDISGNTLSKGMQGFLYGERGVWRPGDTLHLGLIVADREGTPPQSHPVVFTLTNSRGQQVDRTVVPGNAMNMYTYTPSLSPEAPTGTYMLRATIGDVSFSKSLRVETVKPNRLKIQLDLPEGGLQARVQTDLKLTSRWLHGAPARNLDYSATVRFSPEAEPFAEYKDYTFRNVASDFSGFQEKAFEGQLDAEGEAMVQPSFSEPVGAPGMLRATFTTKVFEEGGGFSINAASTSYSPYPSYIGLRTPSSDRYYIETDRDQTFKVVTVNPDGSPQPDQRYRVAVYKLRWGWWWEHDEESLADYVDSEGAEVVYHENDLKTDSKGRGEFDVRIDYPAYGRYLVRVLNKFGGHVASRVVYWDWPDSRERGADRMKGESTVLALTTDKAAYAVGDDARITVPTPLGGNLLVSIENGATVLRHFWKQAEENQTVVKLPITEDMAPNVYVTITLLQPYGQSANDLPIRMYGTVPVMVENKDSHLEPVIKSPKEVRPESPVKFTVSERKGQPMSFTVAVVDQGLLDLTGFRTPNPWDFFYSRQALGVSSMDFYDHVIGAYAGTINRVLSVGGGYALMNAEMSEPLTTRFTPLVRFFGPFHLTKGGKRDIEFDMPNYIGAVRIMVVAEDKGKYGSSEAKMLVRSPLMVQTTLPRILGVKERVEVPVTVFSMSSEIEDVAISVEAEGALELVDNSAGQLRFNKEGDKTIFFPVKTSGKEGVGTVKVVATAGKHRAETEVKVAVRNPNPMISQLVSKTVDKGASVTLKNPLQGETESMRGRVEISALPALGLREKFDYMQNYPYSCMEQQTAKAMVRLKYSHLAKLSEGERAGIDAEVKSYLARASNYQTPNGGFSFWLGYSSPDLWLSSFVGDFLVVAQENSYHVPAAMLQNLKSYLKTQANAWSVGKSRDNSTLNQAYRLYVLARMGMPQMGAMNRLREVDHLTPVARYTLGAAYAIAGNGRAATELVDRVSKGMASDDEVWACFGSPIRDMALQLEALVWMHKEEEAATMLRALSNLVGGHKWFSTQDLAFIFSSVELYAMTVNIAQKGIEGTLVVDGERVRVNEDISSYVYPLASVARDSKVEFTNNSDGSLFVTLGVSGRHTTSEVKASSNDLDVSVTYMSMEGRGLAVEDLELGTEFIAKVTVENPGTRGDIDQLVVDFALPAGWEVQETRGETVGSYESSEFYYQDFRDDRVSTYFNLSSGHSKSFYFLVNASYVGRFALPPTSCHAMYDGAVSASTEGCQVIVRE